MVYHVRIDPELFSGMTPRSIGPFAVPDDARSTFYRFSIEAADAADEDTVCLVTGALPSELRN